MPYLDISEFTLDIEFDVLGFSKEDLMKLKGWKIVGIAETYGDTLYAFVCMFERENDSVRSWCQVPFRYIENHINSM